MVFDISTVVTWLLFLALFPMVFFWMRRAWRIFIKKDYTEVALNRGVSPPNPEKWATLTGLTNLIAGGIALITIIGIVLALFPYKTWSTMAGMTLWGKIFADFIVSRQAHPFTSPLKKKNQPKS